MNSCDKFDIQTGTPAAAFSRLIALGFYDGATDGVAQCAAYGAAWAFSLVDMCIRWDGLDDLRIFALARLGEGDFERLVSLCERTGRTPAFPYWVPLWTFPTAELKAQTESEVDALLSGNAPADWLVAATDVLNGRVIAVRRRGDPPLEEVSAPWAFLGIVLPERPDPGSDQ